MPGAYDEKPEATNSTALSASDWSLRDTLKRCGRAGDRRPRSWSVIEQIEVLDKRINAVVVRDFDRARARARATDSRAASCLPLWLRSRE